MDFDFRLDNKTLHTIATMRSLSAMMVFPYDFSMVCAISQVITNEVRARYPNAIERNEVAFLVANTHVYSDEHEVLDYCARGRDIRVAQLPDFGDLANVRTLFEYGEKLRALVKRRNTSAVARDLDALGLNPEPIRACLIAHAASKLGDHDLADAAALKAGSMRLPLQMQFGAERSKLKIGPKYEASLPAPTLGIEARS